MVEAMWNDIAEKNNEYKSYSVVLQGPKSVPFNQCNIRDIHPYLSDDGVFYQEVYITKALKNIGKTAVMEPSKSLKNTFILRDSGEGQEDTFHAIILAMNRSGQDITWAFQFKKIEGLKIVGASSQKDV